MTLTCTRCGRTGEPAPERRIPFGAAAKQAIAGKICAECWKEWEGMEVKVINEYRLNFLDPEHRATIQRACFDFLQLGNPA